MSEDLDSRLKKALETRDKLAAEIQRIEGRKEAAQRALLEIELEIRSKNLDPNTLDQVVSDLSKAYEQEVIKLEKSLVSVRESLTPYLG